jgi:ABC-2 type transport system ATP-binding protein
MGQTMLQVDKLVKRYNGFTAVDNLTFEVLHGELFGLLGPNGAGKTTTIRTIMGIFAPDGGRVSVLGQPPGAGRSRIGYLPEERGLYPDLKVIEALIYLAELKGTSTDEGRRNSEMWLERVELTDWRSHKVKDLSRGMHQKLQFISSLVHNPDLLILDEPFQGLDPINVELIKTLMRDLQGQGKTIILSAHQMNLVEALCDRILLINQGRGVLYGDLAEIKRRHSPDAVRLRTPVDPTTLPGVVSAERTRDTYTVTLSGTTAQELLRHMVENDMPVEFFEPASAPLEEIFVKVVKETQDV